MTHFPVLKLLLMSFQFLHLTLYNLIFVFVRLLMPLNKKIQQFNFIYYILLVIFRICSALVQFPKAKLKSYSAFLNFRSVKSPLELRNFGNLGILLEDFQLTIIFFFFLVVNFIKKNIIQIVIFHKNS